MMLLGFRIYTYAPDIPIFGTELTDLSLSSMEPLVLIPPKKEVYSFFVEEKQTASRHYFMKATDGFCVTKGSQAPDVFSGPGMRRRQNNCHCNSSAG